MGESHMGPAVDRPSGRHVGLSILPAAVGLALGLIYCWGANSYQVGTLGAPGPGMFPLVVGVFMTLPSLWCLQSELRSPSAAPEGLGEVFWRVPAVIVSIIAYIVLLKPLGFLPTATLMVFGLLLVLGRRPWWKALIFALVTGLVAYYGFSYLGVPLPAGILG
ncbi:MAG: tripartite tricarboxylate transporter TctB family protein [Chloroflexota bacterium]